MDWFNNVVHQCKIIGRVAGYVGEEVKNAAVHAFETCEWHLIPKKVLDWMKQHPYETACIILSTIILINPAVLAPFLSALGFTATGPAAGSLAAAIQSIMGSVQAGSLFAILQSAGMGGGGLFIVAGAAQTLILGPVIARAIYDAMNGNADEAVKNALGVLHERFEHTRQFEEE